MTGTYSGASQAEPARQQDAMELPATKPQDSFYPAPPVGREGSVLGDMPSARPAFSAQRAEQRPAVATAPRQQVAPTTGVQRPAPSGATRTEPKTGIKALFSRLTHQTQNEAIPVEEKLEHHPRATEPAPELTATPADRPTQSQDEGDELEIPAFLRRQAN
jgi:hypothetical protein